MAWYDSSLDSYAPGSSPDSSPSTGPADSSPFPSPTLEPLELDEEPSIIHPFAGSFGSKRQKRINDPPCKAEEPRASKKARWHSHSSLDSAEADEWARQATIAYEEGSRLFNLSKKSLTCIDVQFIRDLKNMVVISDRGLGNSRSVTIGANQRLFNPKAPEIAAQEIRRTFSRHESKNSALLPGENAENIHLYLAQNQITKLPNELWTLDKLTTLSLRDNKIQYLPPEIGNLKNLRDLNVSINRLKFLPSELNKLSLVHLYVHPNLLFLKPPSESRRPVSEPEYATDSPIPSLVELTFRVLSSPPTPDMQLKYDQEGTSRRPPRNVLEYYLPLDPTFLATLSQPLLQTLETCFPESVPNHNIEIPESDVASMQLTGVGQCANPNHAETASFIHPLEQRFTWEKTVAGIVVGGAVPLRWRGCSRGCLAFLDEREKEAVASELDSEFIPLSLNDAPLEFDGDGDD